MENKSLKTFFYLNGILLKIKAFFESDKVLYILAPLLPVYAVFASSTELLKGNLIVLNTIIMIFGVILLFLLTVVSIYHFKNVDVFKLFKREKSNQNLCQGKDKRKSFKKISDKDVFALISENKIFIENSFNKLKSIGIFNSDTSSADFESLIANCFMEFENDFSFKLEVSSMEVTKFVKEFLVVFLKELNSDQKVTEKRIASLLHYKINGGYKVMNKNSLANKNRTVYDPKTTRIYESASKR